MKPIQTSFRNSSLSIMKWYLAKLKGLKATLKSGLTALPQMG